MSKEIEIYIIPDGLINLNTEVLIAGTFPPEKEYVSKGCYFSLILKNLFWNRIDYSFFK